MILETVSNQASRAPGHLDIVHVHVQATVETIMQKALLKSGQSKSVTSEIRTQVATATTWSTNHYTNATFYTTWCFLVLYTLVSNFKMWILRCFVMLEMVMRQLLMENRIHPPSF